MRSCERAVLREACLTQDLVTIVAASIALAVKIGTYGVSSGSPPFIFISREVSRQAQGADLCKWCSWSESMAFLRTPSSGAVCSNVSYVPAGANVTRQRVDCMHASSTPRCGSHPLLIAKVEVRSHDEKRMKGNDDSVDGKDCTTAACEDKSYCYIRCLFIEFDHCCGGEEKKRTKDSRQGSTTSFPRHPQAEAPPTKKRLLRSLFCTCAAALHQRSFRIILSEQHS